MQADLSETLNIFKKNWNFKYLGVLLDQTLSRKDHIDYNDNKISSRLGVLRRAR